METKESPAYIADRLWRAYTPYQRGRNTVDDLSSMLAILLLADFVEAGDEEFREQWERAVRDAGEGLSPLADLRAMMRAAGRRDGFPVPSLRHAEFGFLSGGGPGDAGWMTAFLAVWTTHPGLTRAGFPEICAALLERHVQQSTFASGEYHTPRAVARLVTALAAPRPGHRVLDPACGSGSLLAGTVGTVAGSGRVDGALVEAYATDRGNVWLATMNLAAHGVDRPVVGTSDPVSLSSGQGHGLADRVLSNPPFNQPFKGLSTVSWPFGQPPGSNANFAWLQGAWGRLSEQGMALVIMPARAAWSDGPEAAIRTRMVEGRAILGVIALPAQLFFHTSVPVHIWVLARDAASQLPPGQENSVLFIDAGRLGTQAPRQPRVLSEDETARIGGRFHAWLRSPYTNGDEPGFSRAVAREEILEKGGSLDPRRYIPVEQELSSSAQDLGQACQELERLHRATSDTHLDLLDGLATSARVSRRGVEIPSLSLQEIVDGEVAEGSKPGRLLAGPSGSLIRAEHYVEGDGVPVVMPKDLAGGGFDAENIKRISPEQADHLARFRLECGDVVIARRGELGRCGVVRPEQHGWICGTGCFVLRPPAELDAEYFAAYLRSAKARVWLDVHSTGSLTMKTISLPVLGELPVVLPDRGVQREIAEGMRRLDRHESLLRAQLELTRRMRRDAVNAFFDV
ncbi:N-6 DNA methylase [Streptomyces harbinensis]|uniref:N-6 DNA methylase n=1 Tax=Streptomyces harbinensis TaxID=1176198 RepID=UPI00339AD514